MAGVASAASLSKRLQSPYFVILFLAVFYLVLLAWLWGHFNGDPLGFVHRGTVYSDGDPNGTRGYDGQFYYYTAVHPLHASPFMDNAAFRLQRVFFPLLIFIVSLKQAALVPYAMLLINYLSVLGGTLLVALLLAKWDRSPWFALGYGLCTGLPVALTFDTAEPLAFALIALGIFLWDRVYPHTEHLGPYEPAASSLAPEYRDRSAAKSNRHYWWLMLGGMLAFAASLLTRELALYFMLGYIFAAGYLIAKTVVLRPFPEGATAWSQRFRLAWRYEGPRLLLAIAAFLPLGLWSAYLSITSGYLGVSFVQPFEDIPFLAYWLQISPFTLRSVGYAAQYIVPTTVFCLLGLWRLLRTWRWPSPLLVAMLGNIHLLMFLPHLGYQHQVAVSRYLLGLALASVLWAAAVKPRWVLWLTLLFALTFFAYLYGLVVQDPAYLW